MEAPSPIFKCAMLVRTRRAALGTVTTRDGFFPEPDYKQPHITFSSIAHKKSYKFDSARQREAFAVCARCCLAPMSEVFFETANAAALIVSRVRPVRNTRAFAFPFCFCPF